MKVVLFCTVIGIFPVVLAAHGEDKFGPHGGYIRMPGGFHTEVKIQKNELKVYLLDINWKNPTTKNSGLNAEYINGVLRDSLVCKVQKSEFTCLLPSGFRSENGKLLITANRDGMKGGVAEYLLPLKLLGAAEDSHSNHH